MGQLALPIGLQDHAVFDSFYAHGNEELVALLMAIATRSDDAASCWLWGGRYSGRTHLLQAVCERAGDLSAFVPLAALEQAGPGILDGLASRDVVCIDDIDAVTGNRDWELGLFNLFNELLARGGALVVSAGMAARECPTELPDLSSRLTQLPSYRLRPLADGDRVEALRLRASHRGLEMPVETARFLLSRSRRDMASLYGLLDTLDREAMRAQRRLTIPFVREILRELTAD